MAPLEAAIATGLPCFPCSRNKTPAIPGPGGHKHATADAAALRALWRQYPGALVGVPTGEISGLAVLDVDLAKHREAACWLAANRGRLPRSRSHRTRSGALHFVFQHAHGVRNSQGRLASVDTRGEGGYVIWRPTAGCPAVCGAPPAPPRWLLEVLWPPTPALSGATAIGPATLDQRRLEGLLRRLVFAPEGQRTGVLYWAACRLGEVNQQRGNWRSGRRGAAGSLGTARRSAREGGTAHNRKPF